MMTVSRATWLTILAWITTLFTVALLLFMIFGG